MFNIKKIGLSLLVASILVGCANQNSQMNRIQFMKKKHLIQTKVSFVDNMDVIAK